MFSEGRAMGYDATYHQEELRKAISISVSEDMLLDRYIVSLNTIDELQTELDEITDRLAKIVCLNNKMKANPFIRIIDFFNSLVFRSPIVRK